MPQPVEPYLLATVTDVARVLGRDERTVKRMAGDGRLAAMGCPPVADSTPWWVAFKAVDVDALEQRLRTPTPLPAA